MFVGKPVREVGGKGVFSPRAVQSFISPSLKQAFDSHIIYAAAICVHRHKPLPRLPPLPPTVCIPPRSSQPLLHPPQLAALHPALLGGRRHHKISTSTRASRSVTPRRTAVCLSCCCHLTATSAVGPGSSSSLSSLISGPWVFPQLPCSAGCAGAARGYARTWEEALGWLLPVSSLVKGGWIQPAWSHQLISNDNVQQN